MVKLNEMTSNVKGIIFTDPPFYYRYGIIKIIIIVVYILVCFTFPNVNLSQTKKVNRSVALSTQTVLYTLSNMNICFIREQ